jgi:hypothetical protein
MIPIGVVTLYVSFLDSTLKSEDIFQWIFWWYIDMSYNIILNVMALSKDGSCEHAEGSFFLFSVFDLCTCMSVTPVH